MFNDLRFDRNKYLIVLKKIHQFVKIYKIQKQNLLEIDNIFEKIFDKFKTSKNEKILDKFKTSKNEKKNKIIIQFVDKRVEYDDLIKSNKIRRFERVFNFDSNDNLNNIDDDEKKSVNDDSIVTTFVKFSKKKHTNKHFIINRD